MTARRAARLTAVCRAAIGGAFLLAPQLFMRPWLGRAASSEETKLLARALGSRDLVLAVGTLSAADRALRPWLIGGLVADATDLVVTVAERHQLPRQGRVLVMTIAGAGVALGAVAIATAPSQATG